MKTMILLLTVLTLTVEIQAGDRSFADFFNIIENEKIVGTESKDSKCTIQTNWLKNGDLLVTATSKYLDRKVSRRQVVFSESKNVDYTIDHRAEDESEYTIIQSKELGKEDEAISIVESFTLHQDASGLTSAVLSVMEVNDHSDPSELFFVVCNPNP